MADDDALYVNLDANKVLDAFGKYGKYQMCIYAMSNSVQIIYALNMMIMPFISETPDFECTVPENSNLTRIDQCHFLNSLNQTINCPDYSGSILEYKNKTQTLAGQYNLVCDNAGGVEHGSSIFLLGGMLLAPVIMQLSDIYGRKWPFVICIYTSLAANTGCAFAPNYIIFLALRFIAGMCVASIVAIGQTIALESVSVEFRNMLPILFNTFWVIGYLSAGLFRMITNNWRALYFVATMPGFLFIPYVWWVPETLHYLVTAKRYTEVKAWIKKAEKFNGVKIDLSECHNFEQEEETEKPEEVQRTVLDVFRNMSLFVNFVINGYVFIVMSFSYWALSLFSTEFSSDKMVGFFLSGLVEIPGGILACLMVIYCPRKLSSMSSMAIQGIAMSIAAFISPRSPIMMLLPLIAKLFNSVAWSSHPLLLSESSPTTLRNSILAVCTVLGEAGGVAAPYLKRLEAINERAPALVIGIMSGVATIGILALPETKGKELASDIDDPNYNPGPLINFFKGKKKEKDMTSVREKEEALKKERLNASVLES